MDMYISWIRLRLGKHRKTDVELLELGTLLRVVMREIDHVHRAGLGTMKHELPHLIDDMRTIDLGPAPIRRTGLGRLRARLGHEPWPCKSRPQAVRLDRKIQVPRKASFLPEASCA